MARTANGTTSGFRHWMHTEVFGAVLLLIATIIALGWANSPWHASYFDIWLAKTPNLDFGNVTFPHTVQHWINDGLMPLFFLIVGLEIKRELLVGELSRREAAILPISAALGGVAIPALVFLAVVAGHPGSHGWGIPTATDIAFALGVLALLGSAIPTSLKVFLGALAIVDDLAAIVLIAVVYTSDVNMGWMLVAAGVFALLIGLNLAGVKRISLYLIPGLFLWLAVYDSGIHATIAGVLLAFTIPVRTSEDPSPAGRLESGLHPITSWLVIPLFAIANAGIRLVGAGSDLFLDRVTIGVALGLLLGKPIGIMLGTWLPIKLGFGRRPTDATWSQLVGVSILGGIGFTMSLLINELAFGAAGEIDLRDAAQVGILCASLLAGAVGYVLLHRSKSDTATPLLPESQRPV